MKKKGGGSLIDQTQMKMESKPPRSIVQWDIQSNNKRTFMMYTCTYKYTHPSVSDFEDDIN